MPSIPVPTLDLTPGAMVVHQGRECAVLVVLNLNEVLVRDAETGKVDRTRIENLSPVEREGPKAPPLEDLALIKDEDWNIAQARFQIIRPLLRGGRTLHKVKAQAKLGGVHVATVYRWIELFEGDDCKLSALLPTRRSGGRGKSRLDPQVEAVVQQSLNEIYLTKQRLTAAKAWDDISVRLVAQNLPVPHPHTIRNRIALLSDYLKLKRRVGSREAREKYAVNRGSFPGADYPLAYIQIDHTPMDIIVVDEINRQPIGRPWITMAIDVYSRMVMGYYISLDPPGAISVGLCLAHAILPKDLWLAKHGINAEWPCWGLMSTVHVDNAKEFRGAMLSRACQQYGINLEWRPVARPEYGGHIERYLGTLSRDLHTLPGTTFSSIHERGNYDSTAKAVMSLSELEEWVATHIACHYHQRGHSELDGQSPIKRYEEGILGTSKRPGIGVPKRVADEHRLRLDFLPFEERTVQKYGVALDDIFYFHDVIRRRVHEKDPENPKHKRKFIFRRDPRDISVIYF